MRKRLEKMLFTLLLCFALLALGIVLYLQQPKFGDLPAGARLERIKSSQNYADGQFQNLVPIPKREGRSSASLWWEYLFKSKERLRPADSIPVMKTDLKALDKSQDIVVWLGHSSYFLQLGGKRVLIDPVFSVYAAPVPFVNKAFPGTTNLYTAEDMPEIDVLLVSHDHWEHLDYLAVTALKPKIKAVICGLGVGAYFEQWGFAAESIHEADWFTKLEMEHGFSVHVLPARHYSSRMLSRNKTLWAGFAIVTPQHKVFISGDGGYGPHFKEIGEKFNGFDIVMLDNGQYDKNWPYVHMTPEEAVQAAEDLQAKALLPGHVGKFTIANHPWNEPFQRITNASQNKSYRLLTPIMGEPVELANTQQVFSRWWEKMN